MINLPVLDRLDVTGYGLFPGVEGGEHGLHVQFRPGLTLVLGANGLGKSTLVEMIYRLLTGPFDIPGLAGRADLGSMRLTTTELPKSGRGIFARRVVDGARGAKARLTFRLGAHSVVIERRLNDLSLTFFSVDGDLFRTSEQESFQTEILRLVGVWSFGDWVLLLRHLIFYFENRRALVWHPPAQRQILRLLFLPVLNARKWTEDERAILELDSRMRNLSNALSREERALSSNEIKIETGVDVRQELQTLEKLQGIDEERREGLEGEVVEVETGRQQSRLRLLKAGRFLDQWRNRAVEFGWTPGDLFDVPNETGKCGLAWFLHGDSVRSLEPDGAFMESGRVFDKLTHCTWKNPRQNGGSQ